MNLETRLDSRKRVTSSNCWEWLGAIDSRGYGCIYVNGKTQLVHRVAYKLANGRDANPQVRHKCNNKICFNPDHLLEGTATQNLADRGEGWGTAKNNKDKTHCIRGHELVGKNIYRRRDGKRNCRLCRNRPQ
jgi:hypothetical protein